MQTARLWIFKRLSSKGLLSLSRKLRYAATLRFFAIDVFCCDEFTEINRFMLTIKEPLGKDSNTTEVMSLPLNAYTLKKLLKMENRYF